MRRLAQIRRWAPSPSLTPYKCPAPSVVHQRIEHVKPGRLIVVGDLHGTPELFRLLDTLRYDASADNLILAGDLVNKGPVSLAVLDAIPKLRCWAVRGNHDDAVLGAWLQYRRGGPLNPKFEWARDLTDEQAAVLLELPFTVSVPEYGIAVVHAGFVPGVPLEHQDMWAMYKMRNVVPLEPGGEELPHPPPQQQQLQQQQLQQQQQDSSGGAPSGQPPGQPTAGADGGVTAPGSVTRSSYRPVEKAKDGGEPWAALWRGPPHVFFGHDARRRLQLHPHATGLDTGCVYGGQLTAAVVPPLAELRARSPGFVTKMRGGEGLTREDLMAEIVAVQAALVYSPPSGAGAGTGTTLAGAAAGAGPDAGAPVVAAACAAASGAAGVAE